MQQFLLLFLCSPFIMANILLPDNFHANFMQKITNPKKKVIKYSGEVAFSNKDNFKWSYLKPTKKEVCTNGKELLVVDHDLEQVSSYFLNKGVNITAILKEAKLHHENVYVAKYENRQYTIKVSKKQKLHSIAYFDDLDNKVQILFTKMHYGKGKINSSKMLCNYPKYYDKIEG